MQETKNSGWFTASSHHLRRKFIHSFHFYSDRHNEDGSYSFGYEGADGTFKIETKYPTGEVYGKYGFVDDTGKVREVEYGASQRGFEPMGTDINVPPTSIQGNTIAGPNDPEDDGQYREDPSIYHTDPKYTNGEYYRPLAKRPKYSSQQDYQIQKQTWAETKIISLLHTWVTMLYLQFLFSVLCLDLCSFFFFFCSQSISGSSATAITVSTYVPEAIPVAVSANAVPAGISDAEWSVRAIPWISNCSFLSTTVPISTIRKQWYLRK